MLQTNRLSRVVISASLLLTETACTAGEGGADGALAAPTDPALGLTGDGVRRHPLPPGVEPGSVSREYVRAQRLANGRCRFDETPDTLRPGESVSIFIIEQNPSTCEFIFGRAPVPEPPSRAYRADAHQADTVRVGFGTPPPTR